MKKTTGSSIFLPDLSLDALLSILESKIPVRDRKPRFNYSYDDHELTDFLHPLTTSKVKVNKDRNTLGEYGARYLAKAKKYRVPSQ